MTTTNAAVEEEKRNNSPINETAVEMTFGIIAGATLSGLGQNSHMVNTISNQSVLRESSSNISNGTNTNHIFGQTFLKSLQETNCKQTFQAQ